MTVPSSHLHYLSRLHPADFAVMCLFSLSHSSRLSLTPLVLSPCTLSSDGVYWSSCFLLSLTLFPIPSRSVIQSYSFLVSVYLDLSPKPWNNKKKAFYLLVFLSSCRELKRILYQFEVQKRVLPEWVTAYTPGNLRLINIESGETFTVVSLVQTIVRHLIPRSQFCDVLSNHILLDQLKEREYQGLCKPTTWEYWELISIHFIVM